MTQQLATVILAAKALSQREKLELIQVLSQDLQQSAPLTEGNTVFWSAQSLEDLIATQLTPIIDDVSTLSGNFWPEDETADDINNYIDQRRSED